MIGDTILLAIRELRRNLMRALLTTLGIVIGVASVIAMVTLGNGANASIANTVGALGRNVLILAPGAPRSNGPPGPTPQFEIGDVDAIRREIHNLRAVAPVVQQSIKVVAGNRNASTQAVGTDNMLLIAQDSSIALGREFNDAEIRSGLGACILGETVRIALFGASNPLGERVRIGNMSCTIIGVLTPKGKNTFGQDQDDVLIMPLRAAQRRIVGNNFVALMWISATSQEATPKIISDITLLMRDRRHLTKETENNFTVQDIAQVAQTLNQVTLVLTLFLTSIAAVSLLVGGIGIMNIMLVSVTERTREIGIRLAIGAREKDVLLQFLVEAVMMSVLGGAVGIVLGLGLSGIAVTLLHLPFVPSISVVVIAFLFSGCIGIAFGYFPALRAARLDPIKALRHE